MVHLTVANLKLRIMEGDPSHVNKHLTRAQLVKTRTYTMNFARSEADFPIFTLQSKTRFK